MPVVQDWIQGSQSEVSCIGMCLGVKLALAAELLHTANLAVAVLLFQELHSELKKVQAELNKYGHVNKKALDQFSNFTDQQQDLKRRREEVEQSCTFMGLLH